MKQLALTLMLFTNIAFSQNNQNSRILFLGSSSTYCHDMPLQVSNWLNIYADWNSKAFLTGRSGTGFHEYLRAGFEAQYGLENGQTILEKIEAEKYGYVVIQQITYFMAEEDSLEIIEGTKLLCDAIRKAGGKPVFYEMGWRLGPENETGREMILKEALDNGIEIYVPCSRAWKKVRAERPDIELHNLPDTDHPGTLGTYLNLCCFFAALTGKSPVGLPADVNNWPRFGAFDKLEASNRLENAQLDYYHSVMPVWMQQISIMQTESQIDEKTAKYLQKTAWKTWKQINKKL
ncbi:hypothetical protein [uncultured Draconibacterium sp.]|uniref:hypothetical protein n=1 Tax=uncultured Draconibacterium sp. TaxID=1573823 RepID=UPI0029C69CB5|nr:hypothetical protein [uncultured Draconibacterium sp.]